MYDRKPPVHNSPIVKPKNNQDCAKIISSKIIPILPQNNHFIENAIFPLKDARKAYSSNIIQSQKCFDKKIVLNNPVHSNQKIIQRKVIGFEDNETIYLALFYNKQLELDHYNSEELEEYIRKKNSKSNGAFTTVGFEYEFLGYNIEGLNDHTHVKLAESEGKINGLPFVLETDKGNVLELVTPPFIFESDNEMPIPKPEDIQRVNKQFKTELNCLRVKTFPDLIESFRTDYFTLKVNEDYPQLKNREKAKITNDNKKLEGSIGTQINFATSPKVYNSINHLNDKSEREKNYIESDKIMRVLYRFRNSALEHLLTIMIKRNCNSNSIYIFFRELANSIAESVCLPLLDGRSYNEPGNEYYRLIRTCVKDINVLWLKDSLVNYALGVMSINGLLKLKKLIKHIDVDDLLKEFILDLELYSGPPEVKDFFIMSINNYMKAYIYQVKSTLADDLESEDDLQGKVKFGSHDGSVLGIRQDTYISEKNIKKSTKFEDMYLSVVEYRKDDDFDISVAMIKSDIDDNFGGNKSSIKKVIGRLKKINEKLIEEFDNLYYPKKSIIEKEIASLSIEEPSKSKLKDLLKTKKLISNFSGIKRLNNDYFKKILSKYRTSDKELLFSLITKNTNKMKDINKELKKLCSKKKI